jgi:hypothetical protein
MPLKESRMALDTAAKGERPREAAIREVNRLLESSAALRATVRSNEVLYRKMLKSLKQGTPISEAMDDVHAGSARLTLTETLESFELVRHQSRLSLIVAGLTEGMSIGELGRSWGFSRQLASRYAREARGHSESLASP